MQPSGVKSFIVNYRVGDGGRKAPNRRLVVGRYGRVTSGTRRGARRRNCSGGSPAATIPAGERDDARGMPTLGEACDDYIESGRHLAEATVKSYRRYSNLYLGDWRSRPLDAISRKDVEARFHLITDRHGAVPADQCLSFLRSVYRRPCVNHDGLRNPVELWLAGGGRYHPKRRKRISSPAKVLPKWRAGIDAVVRNPVHRDVFLFGLYTGMRRSEIFHPALGAGRHRGRPVPGRGRRRRVSRWSFRSRGSLGRFSRAAGRRARLCTRTCGTGCSRR